MNVSQGAYSMQEYLFKEFNAAISKPPVDLDDLCLRLGIELVKQPMESHVSGMLEPLPNSKYRITVNDTMSEGRQRFTIAHELGHLALHRHLIGDGLDDRAMRSSKPGCYDNTHITKYEETEANKFAASLLLPKDAVLKKAAELGRNNLSDLAKYFKVSEEAMQIRLNTLLR